MNYKTQKYRPIDIEHIGKAVDNPFYTELKGLFYGPDAQTIAVPGFYAGGNKYTIRFSPTSIGMWTYTTESPLKELDGIQGTVECTAGNLQGGIVVDRNNQHHFCYEGGTPYFMMAYEADWLWAPGLGDTNITKIKEFIASIKDYGFNCVIVNSYAYDTPWAPGKTSDKDYGPPPARMWEGTKEVSNFDRFNLEYFLNFDRMMSHLMDEGVAIHLFIKVYNKSVNWPGKYTKQDDLLFKYLVSRYQAYPNIIWDYSKETYYELDKDYVKNRVDLIRSLDGYHRLITVHDDPLFYANKIHSRGLDFYTAQQHGDLYASAIIDQQAHNWPVLNSEFSYERGGPKDTEILPSTLCHTAEEVIAKTYEVVMAGAYPAYYYTCTAWDVFDYSYIPPGYKYIKIMVDFFTSIEWWRLKPHMELCDGNNTANRHGILRCLADPGREYVFYTTPKTRGIYHVENRKGMEMVWMNIQTGEKIKQEFPLPRYNVSPFTDAPSILHIRYSC